MIRVTEHAMERLFERGTHSPLLAEISASAVPLHEAVAARLLRACCAAEKLGQRCYHVTLGGLRFVVRDGVVVTVLAPEHQHRARKNGIARPREAAQL